MKVGFAVEANAGIESKVYNHFGSAPLFIIVDAATKEITTVNNKDLNHAHGACNPIKALDGQSVDAMVVGGIGAGALSKLNAMGIKVYGSAAVTVKENCRVSMRASCWSSFRSTPAVGTRADADIDSHAGTFG